MTKVNVIQPEAEQVEDNPVKAGDWFCYTRKNSLHVLISFDNNKVLLSNIINGDPWGSPILVNDPENLTQPDLKLIFGGFAHEFTRVKSVDITNVILEK